jgi:hypothetical protein
MPSTAHPNAFIGRHEQPTDASLADALGHSKAAWDQLLADLAQDQITTGREWKSYSPKMGWSLRVKHKARTVAWLAPHQDSFMVVFILGDKAVRAAITRSDLPKRIVEAIKRAPKYPEGTGVRVEVNSIKDLDVLKKLAAIKLAN